MATVVRTLLVLLTALSACAAGALDGRVLCVAGAGHVAIEDPHASDHATGRHDAGLADDDGGADSDQDEGRPGHGGAPHGGCVDIRADGTLVRQISPAAWDHHHARLAQAMVPPVLTAVPIVAARGGPAVAGAADHPPALGDRARLRSIILLV